MDNGLKQVEQSIIDKCPWLDSMRTGGFMTKDKVVVLDGKDYGLNDRLGDATVYIRYENDKHTSYSENSKKFSSGGSTKQRKTQYRLVLLLRDGDIEKALIGLEYAIQSTRINPQGNVNLLWSSLDSDWIVRDETKNQKLKNPKYKLLAISFEVIEVAKFEQCESVKNDC